MILLWENIKNIIYKLFGVKPISDGDLQRTKADAAAFGDISKINFTAIFAMALSTLAFSDSSITVTGGKRAEFLNAIALRHWKTIKQNISVGNGCGMIASIPYSFDGGKRIGIDTIAKDRFIISGAQGGEITAISALSDLRVIDNHKYARWTDYSVENGIYTIRQKATRDGNEIPLINVKQWQGIPEEIKIGGCERLPLGVYRCPANNRKPMSLDGVPITFGCGQTIRRIEKCLEQIDREFGDKAVKIFADTSLFDKDDHLTDIYKRIRSGSTMTGNKMLDVFDPAFRDASLFNRLEHLLTQLEKEVGTGRGILTDLSVNGGTATEIRRATFSTFALCDDIHESVEEYFNSLIYGVDVLASYYNMSATSEYKVEYDWAYSMLEDTDSSFNQLMQAYSARAVDNVEIRQFLKPDESIDEAREAVAAIRAENPSMEQQLGD